MAPLQLSSFEESSSSPQSDVYLLSEGVDGTPNNIRNPTSTSQSVSEKPSDQEELCRELELAQSQADYWKEQAETMASEVNYLKALLPSKPQDTHESHKATATAFAPENIPSGEGVILIEEPGAYGFTVENLSAKVELLDEVSAFAQEKNHRQEEQIHKLTEEGELKDTKIEILEGIVKSLLRQSRMAEAMGLTESSSTEAKSTPVLLATFRKGARELLVRKSGRKNNIELVWSKAEAGKSATVRQSQKEAEEEETVFV